MCKKHIANLIIVQSDRIQDLCELFIEHLKKENKILAELEKAYRECEDE